MVYVVYQFYVCEASAEPTIVAADQQNSHSVHNGVRLIQDLSYYYYSKNIIKSYASPGAHSRGARGPYSAPD